MSTSLCIQRHHRDVDRPGRPRSTLQCRVSDCRGCGHENELHICIVRTDSERYDYGSVTIYSVTADDCDALIEVANAAKHALCTKGTVEVPKELDINDLSVGDVVTIEYTKGERLKGGRISGVVKEFHFPHRQVKLDTGWCGHDGDLLIKHERVSCS